LCEGIKHGTRIGRSWGAAEEFDRRFSEYELPQAEYDKKPEVDVTSSLAIPRIVNAVMVINTFVAKYVDDLKWDYMIINEECKTSLWEPRTNEGVEDDGWSLGYSEGICGIICLGAANDCVGSINGMTYQQCNEGEVVCFTGVGNHPITGDEHGYCLESVGVGHPAWQDVSQPSLYRKR